MSDEAKTDPKITVAANGPYLVSGAVPVRQRAAVLSEHGEPLTWRAEAPDETRARYALCRCGKSAKKPYCDGTHGPADFDGTESAPIDAYADRRKHIPASGIDVYDDRPTCVHAGFCGNRVANVWKLAAATDDSVVRAQVMAMIEKCPSGALTYAVDDAVIEQVLPAEIGVIENGPLWVTGGIPIHRSDGEPLETRNRVTLCRCGESANKPLCDGTHKEAGFVG